MLGEGANILISDNGFPGLVIRPRLTQMTHINDDNQSYVTAGAGVSFHDLIVYCLNNNLIGLEEFSGIPGTVGGSLFINIHYFEFLLSQFVTQATVIHAKTGKIMTVDRDWFQFGYNQSTLHNHPYYVIDATFCVTRTDAIHAAFAGGRHQEIIRHRSKRYPDAGTCGSFFRNFHDTEVSIISNGKKMIYVAYYLDKIGIKGVLTHGNAGVSYQHANMLVNKGHATTNDIIMLARTMQDLVQEEFNLTPQPECQLIGFSEYPLLG
jgi:UDP-N-acetylmuramate dehydrogenase